MTEAENAGVRVIERILRPADGTTLPHKNGWRILRSVDPDGPEPMLLWERVPTPAIYQALRSLANEVSALRAFEKGVRQEIGNTNFAALMLRAEEAAAILEQSK